MRTLSKRIKARNAHWFAVKSLTENKAIPEKAVTLSGMVHHGCGLVSDKEASQLKQANRS